MSVETPDWNNPGRRTDLVDTLRQWRLWAYLGWRDVRQRYRGSVLGPVWLAGSVLVITLGAGSLYAALLDVETRRLLPFISLSVSLWLFVSLTILEGSNSFLSAALVIRNTVLPLGGHVARALGRNLLVLAHSVPVVIAVFLWYRFVPAPTWPLAIIGFVLLLANVAWMAWMAALVSTRFRDVGQLIAYGLQFAIFITPVFWAPEQAGERHVVLTFNPFHHMLAVVRGPILGETVTPESWAAATLMAVIGFAATAAFHARVRHQVVHWL